MFKLNSNKNKIIILTFSVGFFLVSITSYGFYTAKEYFAFKKPLISSSKSFNTIIQKSSITENKTNINSSFANTLSSTSPSSLILASSSVKELKYNENRKTVSEIEVKVVKAEPSILKDNKAEIIVPKEEEEVVKNLIADQESSKFKSFQGNQWKELYETAKLSYPNIKSDYGGLDYFGDPALNKIATDIAIARGFVKRSLVEDESKLMYFERYLVQKPMGEAISQLFREMRANGHPIVFLSGYRGIQEQSQVFGAEFSKQSFAILGHEATNQEILDRKADSVISKTLETVALPGYSRHHLGYTVDVTESGTYYKDFERTGSYEWMSKDNFVNLKKYGIIPSYPKGVQDQGPEPESWEFVYVGTDILKS